MNLLFGCSDEMVKRLEEKTTGIIFHTKKVIFFPLLEKDIDEYLNALESIDNEATVWDAIIVTLSETKKAGSVTLSQLETLSRKLFERGGKATFIVMIKEEFRKEETLKKLTQERIFNGVFVGKKDADMIEDLLNVLKQPRTKREALIYYGLRIPNSLLWDDKVLLKDSILMFIEYLKDKHCTKTVEDRYQQCIDRLSNDKDKELFCWIVSQNPEFLDLLKNNATFKKYNTPRTQKFLNGEGRKLLESREMKDALKSLNEKGEVLSNLSLEPLPPKVDPLPEMPKSLLPNPSQHNHDYQELMDKRIEATCTTEGTSFFICKGCGRKIRKSIPKKEHVWKLAWGRVPTCNESGYLKRSCSVCGVEEKLNTVPAQEHQWGDWIQIYEPSCVKPGLKTRTCLICKTVDRISLPSSGHKFENGRCIICGKEKKKIDPQDLSPENFFIDPDDFEENEDNKADEVFDPDDFQDEDNKADEVFDPDDFQDEDNKADEVFDPDDFQDEDNKADEVFDPDDFQDEDNTKNEDFFGKPVENSLLNNQSSITMPDYIKKCNQIEQKRAIEYYQTYGVWPKLLEEEVIQPIKSDPDPSNATKKSLTKAIRKFLNRKIFSSPKKMVVALSIATVTTIFVVAGGLAIKDRIIQNNMVQENNINKDDLEKGNFKNGEIYLGKEIKQMIQNTSESVQIIGNSLNGWYQTEDKEDINLNDIPEESSYLCHVDDTSIIFMES